MRFFFYFLIISFIFNTYTLANTNKKIPKLSGCTAEVNEKNFINSQNIKIKNIEVDTHD